MTQYEDLPTDYLLHINSCLKCKRLIQFDIDNLLPISPFRIISIHNHIKELDG